MGICVSYEDDYDNNRYETQIIDDEVIDDINRHRNKYDKNKIHPQINNEYNKNKIHPQINNEYETYCQNNNENMTYCSQNCDNSVVDIMNG